MQEFFAINLFDRSMNEQGDGAIGRNGMLKDVLNKGVEKKHRDGPAFGGRVDFYVGKDIVRIQYFLTFKIAAHMRNFFIEGDGLISGGEQIANML